MRFEMQGFKQRDRVVDIAPRSLIVAPNGRGKSAIADGMRFTALGFVPSFGKLPADTADLMRGAHLETRITLPDGRWMGRALDRDGDALRRSSTTSWVSGKPVEHDAAITRLFGTEAQDVVEALDVKQLLAMTPAMRAARIETLLGAGAADTLLERIGRLTVGRVLEIDAERLPQDWRPLMASLPPGREQALKAISPELEAVIDEHGLPGLAGHVNTEKRAADTEGRNRRAALTELETRAAATGPAPRTAAALESRRAEILRLTGAADALRARERDRSSGLEQARKDLGAAQEALETGRLELERVKKETGEFIEHLEASVAKFDADINTTRMQIRTIAVDKTRLDQIDAELGSMRDEPVEELAGYERMLEQLRGELEKAKANPWAEVREIGAKIAELAPTPRDPRIESEFTPLVRRLYELAEANRPSTAELEREIQAAEDMLIAKGETAAAAMGRNVTRATRRTELETERATHQRAIDKAQTAAGADAKKVDQEVADIETKRAAAIAAIDNARERRRTAEAALNGPTTAIATAMARINTLGVAVDVPNVEELTAELARVDEQLETVRGQAALVAEIKTISDEVALLEARADVLHALEWAIKRVREETIEEQGHGLMARIDAFLAGAGRKERPYIEAHAGVCNIGWIDEEGNRVSVRALSGGQWAVFTAALAAAIIVERAGSLRVLLVEAGECDAEHLEQIIGGIDAVADELSYAIVMTPHAPDSISADWEIIDLQAVAA